MIEAALFGIAVMLMIFLFYRLDRLEKTKDNKGLSFFAYKESLTASTKNTKKKVTYA